MKISYLELAKRIGDMILCNEIVRVDENIFDNIINGGEPPEDWNESERATKGQGGNKGLRIKLYGKNEELKTELEFTEDLVYGGYNLAEQS